VKLVDLNILLYAINEDSAHHAAIHRWWLAALAGDDPVGLAWTVLLGFLRLTTNPKVFATPLTTEQALSKVEAWLAHPNVRVVTESEEHWRTLRSLLQETGTAGNLTTDAHLAALAISQGAILVSCDTDFGRFAKLQWKNPLGGKS
jgi:toxin-antitoxin system PIN domain toxin